MKNKHKLIIKTTALSVVTAMGVTTIAVSCGETEGPVKKPENKRKVSGKDTAKNKDVFAKYTKKYKFDNKIFNTIEEAKKAQKDKINAEVDKQLLDSKNKKLVYVYDGKEYMTKQELLSGFKEKNQIHEFLFSSPNLVNGERKTFEKMKKFIQKDAKKIFSVNNKLFKTKDKVIDEYLKSGNGDGSGKTFVSKLFSEKKQVFGGKESILGLNKKAIDSIGAGNNRVYVTQGNIKKNFLQNISNIEFEKRDTSLKAIDHSSEFSKYKAEFLKVIKEFERFQREDGDDWYYHTLKAGGMKVGTQLPSGHVLKSDLFLSDAREVDHWTKSWFITTGVVYKKSKYWTVKDEVNATTNLKDLDKVWKLFASSTWKLHAWTKSNGHTHRSVTLSTIIDWDTPWLRNGYKPHGALNRYKDNSSFNFSRRFSVKDKWFKTEKLAEKEIIKFSQNAPKIRGKIAFSQLKSLDFDNLTDLKSISTSIIRDALNSTGNGNNLFIDASGISKNNPLNSLKTTNGIVFLNSINSLISNIIDRKKLISIIKYLSESKIKTTKISRSGVFTKKFTSTAIVTKIKLDFKGFKLMYKGKAYKDRASLLSDIMLSNAATGIFDGTSSNKITVAKLLEKINSKANQEERLKNAIKISTDEINSKTTTELFDYETGEKAPKNAKVGINRSASSKVGDGSGNNYINVKATSEGDISHNSKTIIGKNFSASEIKEQISKHNQWSSSSTPNNIIQTLKQSKSFFDSLVDGDSINTLPKTNTLESGRVLTKSGVEPKGDDLVVIDKTQTNDDIFSTAISNIKKTPSKNIFKGGLSKAEFTKKIKTEISNKTNYKFIDEFEFLSETDQTLKDIVIPKIEFNGPDGSAKVKEIDLGSFVSIEYKIIPKGKTRAKDITFKIDEQNFKNGDQLLVLVQGEDGTLTRKINVNNLKIDIKTFFKTTNKTIHSQKEEVLQTIQKITSKMIPSTKETFSKLGKELKTFIATPIQDRDEATKEKLIKSIKEARETIDSKLFDMLATNKNSLLNVFIQELDKHNVYLKNISEDGVFAKEGIRSEINDLLDIFKVSIDHIFEFISNSLYWKPSWKTHSNLIANESNLDSVINSNIDKETKVFLKELKKNKDTFFSTSNERKNAGLQTILEVMNKSSNNFNVYKEVQKDGKTIFHITANENSREITNIFRNKYKMTPFRKSGTIDNIGIEPKGTVDNFVDGALQRAKQRINNNWKDVDSKDTKIDEIYAKHKKGASTNDKEEKDGGSGGFNIGSLIPTIKDLLSGSISNIFENMGETIGGLIGVQGIINIPSIFDNSTQSGFDLLINMENDIAGLLTHIIGDSGNVVLDIQKNSKGEFELKNYYSPQIRVIDKSNNNKITYRKDDLDKFFTRLKPFMAIIFEVLGSMGK